MYQPREDSFFLSGQLKNHLRKEKNKKLKILDMGCGSGIQAETAKAFGFKNILCADIEEESVKHAKKLSFKAKKSNLFEKIKSKFDLIIFNPPYLPEHKFDKKKDTTGGKLGDETLLAFLKQAKSHLNSGGKILLLLSSFTPKTRINNLIKKSYKKKLIAKQNMFFEKLEVWLLS